MHSQKRMFVILAAVLVLGAATMFAANNSMAGVALKQDITFNAPTVVGGSCCPRVTTK